MSFFRKIKWRRGMEITPATFEAVDRYNETLAATSRRMSVRACHGLLPHSDINFPITVIEDSIAVQVYSLEAVSRSGILFQIAGDSISLRQPHACGRECYVVVHSDGDVEQEINDVPYSKPRFEYDYSQLDDIGPDSIPIAKLFLNNNSWNVQELYIPPCMSVGAHPELFKIVQKCDALLNSIILKYSNKSDVATLLSLRLLSVELHSYDGSESPKDFFVLLNKIVVALSSLSPSSANPSEQKPFNNDDILLAISPLVDYLVSVESSALDPTPKPEVKPKRPMFEGPVWDAETR